MDYPRDYNAGMDFVDRLVDEGLGDKIAFIDAERSITYSELKSATDRMGRLLDAQGIGREDRIAMIVLDTIDPAPYIVFTHLFAPSPPVVLAVNDKSFVADSLAIDIAPTFGISGALLIENAPGCPEPTFEEQASVQLSLVWSSPCVDPGEQVAVHVAGDGAGGFNVGSLPYQFEATLGDVNCDGAVTIVDAQLIAQLILGRFGELPCPYRADVDEDGGVFITDAQLIAQLVAGRIQSLPPS